ncbi:MAG: large repetitive protein, partial [Candidatus Cloacimonadota bacterium]|nr:large repetitive protein [Candidatus Cloacimonadota bacterium]
YLRTSTTSPNSPPNCVQMANSSDAAATIILVSPPFDDDIDFSNLRIRFMGKGATGHLLQVGTMSDPLDPTTFSMAQQLDIPSNWNEYVVNLTNHTAAGQYVAFKHGLGSTYDTTYLDDVSFELIAPNDLAALSIIGNTTPSIDAATNYTVDVFNNGTATQSDYQVQLLDGDDNILATQAGTTIAPDETVSIALTYTPTTEGPMVLKGKVVLASDVNAMNDVTPDFNISVQPADVIAVTIGSGDETQGIPWEFYYKNSLFQCLYYPDEFGLFGQINAIAFYNTFNSNLTQMPVKLWLGTTTEADLSAGWLDPTSLTLVFDGNLDFPSGENTITVPLIQPFNYFSGNLVLYANRPMDTQYYSSGDDFLAQTVGNNRARKLQSDSTTYDPMAPLATGTLSGTFPKTTFLMTVDGMGSISGTVTSGGDPLGDVQITLEDTAMETYTTGSGEFSFPYVLEDTYTLLAHKVGYEDYSVEVTVVEDEETIVNIVMTPSASVNVTGHVTGSDAPTVPLSDVEVSLSGVLDYTAFGDASGNFTVENVLSGNTYDYAIMRTGYQTATGTITVGSTDYDMGNIVLEELTLPPSGLTATLNDTETAVDLIWSPPGTPGNFYFFDFESGDGDWIPSATWNAVGDWEYTSDYDVAEWDPVNEGGNINPPPNAYSGTGMWGTVINSNYTNSAGSNYLTQTFDLSGFENTEMRFWSWENVFGNFDYCQILVNGTLVWGPSWEYTGTTWLERTIDLSAYDGMSDVEITLEMYATSVVDYAGWYVDDIYIGPADQEVTTSPPSVIPGDFRGLTELQAAELAETRAAARPARRIANNLRQPVRNPSRIPVGYRVWRLINGQENTETAWVNLTPETITDTTFTDPGWESFPDGLYRWAVKTVYTNNVLSNPRFSNTIRKQPNDMSALTIAGNSTPTVGAASNYIVTVKNTGTSAQEAGAYTVKIMSGTTQLASVDGPAIAVDEEIGVTVPWVPSAEGEIAIRGVVVLPGDSDDSNDATETITVHVMPAGQFGYTVGEGDILERVPMDMYYKNSLFQMIIYNADLGNFFGFLTGIQFYNNFVTDLPNMPTKIWLQTTTLDDLESGWVAMSDSSTLVFNGNVNYPTGENTITIPFTEPFMWLNGENLLVTVNRPMDTQYYSSSDKFRAQTIGTNRARKYQSDSTTIDPTNPSDSGTLSGTFPMTTFLGFPGGVGHLSGNVTGIDNAPLEGVLVEIDGAGYQTTTDENGDYQIQYILPGTYDVIFSRYGYITQTQELELEEDEEAVINVNMQPMPTVSVSGTILASDTGNGLAGAVIALSGYADYTESTDGNGDFLFDAVYANESYEYIISCPGYTSTTGIINVGATDYEMGEIILNEIAYAPHSVVAELNTTYTAADIVWEAPDPNAIEILESFEDTAFPPQDWSQVITNNGPANTAGVYPTFTRLGNIEIAGNNNATPTHGNYQTGLWWSYEHQDEWLITPTFNCPPDAYIRFDSYVFLGSDNGDHYYVKVSTNGGSTWQILWDASTETGGQITYDAPFVVDLAAWGGQQITLAFHAEDPPSNDGLWFTWFIDNIYIGNAITMVNFDGPALMTRRTANASYQAAAETFRRDGRATRNNSSIPAKKSTTRDSRLLEGYDIYRFVSGQENNEANWTQLNDELVSTLNFSDEGWGGLPNGTYRWGVKAVYTAGVSSPAALSNPLLKDDVTGNIVGFVRKQNGQGIPNATVTASGGFSTNTNSVGAYSLTVPVGVYTVTASAASYDSLSYENITVAPGQNTTLNFILEPSSNGDELIPVTATALNPNYPNPFNPETTISYDILEPCKVRLDVYNIKGQKVRSLLNEYKGSGRYSIVFDARDDNGKALSSGVYLYRFTAGKYNATRKMMLME